jgi:hypothetical protein
MPLEWSNEMSTAVEVMNPDDDVKATGTAVAQRAEGRAPVVQAQGAAPSSMLEILNTAVLHNTPVDTIERLVELKLKLDSVEAQKAFSSALAAFQAECPPVKKGSKANITSTRTGGTHSYTFAELDDIARTVNPVLAKNGLSYSWDSTVDKDTLTCVCTLRHSAGHSVTASFKLPTATNSSMSEQQKIGSALTFAKRQSLSSVLGITTTDDDTDASDVDPTPISEDQVIAIDDLIREKGVNIGRFLKFMNVPKVSEIKAVDYRQAITALEQWPERKEPS